MKKLYIQLIIFQLPFEINQLPKNKYKFFLLNCRSLNSTFKCLYINDLILSDNISVCFLTETWFNDKCLGTVKFELLPPNYTLINTNRIDKKGGGIAVIFNNNIPTKRIPNDLSLSSFEYLEIEMFLKPAFPTRFICIYRSPQNSITQFLIDLQTLLNNRMKLKCDMLLLGDINIHVESNSDIYSLNFNEIISAVNFTQTISKPTHLAGHTLDILAFQDSNSLVVENIEILPIVQEISDHAGILFSIRNVLRLKPNDKIIDYRLLSKINHSNFTKDLQLQLDAIRMSDNLDTNQLANSIDFSLRNLLDCHAPLKHCKTKRRSAPWMTSEILVSIRLRRKAERKFRIDPSLVNKSLFITAMKACQKLVVTQKKQHFTNELAKINSQRSLFSICNKLLNRNTKSSDCNQSLSANQFSTFFSEKIHNIRSNIISSSKNHNVSLSTSLLNEFCSITVSDVLNIFHKYPCKTSNIDPLPKSVLEKHFDTLAPILVQLINSSFVNGCFPDIYKTARITPLLKKPTLSNDNLNNYRPVSNLHFFSKIIERCVLFQLRNHCTSSNLLPIFQSAFRPHHSVESALIHVSDDILKHLNARKSVILILLDMSAAFDTVDYKILLETLSYYFGIRDKALSWIKSYLLHRSFTVQYNNNTSNCHTLNFGVPQGSVLGPLLFSMYISPISTIFQDHNISFHCFADDIQLWLPFDHTDQNSTNAAIHRIENCLTDLKCWMNSSYLKLNADKTEMIVISRHIKHESQIKINFDGVDILPSSQARNLGVIFDSQFKFNSQIMATTKSCSFWLKNLYSLKKYLPDESLKILVHAFITSRLDFCNSLLNNLPKYETKRLQIIQNLAARLITNTPRLEHISPSLYQLHWLPICYRAQFKALTFIHNYIYGESPDYIKSILSLKSHIHNTRFSSQTVLTIPSNLNSKLGQRCFSYYASNFWNHLPLDLRKIKNFNEFKMKLKTYLFKLAYSNCTDFIS